MLKVCLLIAPLLLGVASYRDYQQRIPNGDSVPYPCKPNYIWDGVGHFLDEGTGFRNPFGADFEAEGKQWTQALCQMDSDGDGLTNGQELGDPDCEWTPGKMPKRLVGLSHPGICDPWDEPGCFKKPLTHPLYTTQEEWMRAMCKPKEFVCDSVNDTDVRNVTVRLAPTPVPAKETTYMCQIFDLSQVGMPDGDYHMIAVEPIIDNKNVMHHIALTGCMDHVPASSGPYECGMLAHRECQEFLSIWTVGFSGECMHTDAGIRIGTKGYKRVALQYHWNNPELKSNHVDSSGLILHYTPKLRPYDSGMLVVGSDFFYLDPGKEEITLNSHCTPTCTNNLMTGPVSVTMAWNHMHYAGKKMVTEVIRNNTHVSYLANDPIYSYDSPQMHFFTENPIQLMPGDEIRTTCSYNTLRRTTTTFYGDATSDEMCFGFITYYPKQNIQHTFCVDIFEVSFCDYSTHGDCANISRFNPDQVGNSTIYQEIVANCRPYSPCLSECVDTVVKHMQSDACLQGNMWLVVQNRFLMWSDEGKDMLARILSCKSEADQVMIG